MPSALRVGLVVVGVATAVYGVASLTGWWLGTPPWWETRGTLTLDSILRDDGRVQDPSPPPAPELVTLPAPHRERTSAIVTALGLAIAAAGAWPRRTRSTTP